MANLYAAYKQWATRPADQRFWTVEEMLAACRKWKSEAVEAEDVPLDSISFGRIGKDGGEIALRGGTGKEARLLNYSFGQAAGLVGAPAGYLRKLPPALVVECLKEGLAQRQEKTNGTKAGNLNILFRENGGLDVRAITSDRYARFWNADLLEKVLPLVQDKGWRVPPARPAEADPRARPATEADVLKGVSGLSVKVGDMIAPAGLYASDKDIFCFMVNESRVIEYGGGINLYRGFFLQNSEVGDCAIKLVTFLYDGICGNHIVWGATGVSEIKVRHIGNNIEGRSLVRMQAVIRDQMERNTQYERQMISDAKDGLIIGKDREAVVKKLYEKRIAGKKVLDKGFETAERFSDTHKADPRSPWGMVCGLTRVSQGTEYADQRVELDRAAGKILKIRF